MPKRKTKSTSYKICSKSPSPMEIEDHNCRTIILPQPVITYFGSLYESGRRIIYDDEYGFSLLQLNEFDIILQQTEEPRIIGILDTIDGLSTDRACVLKKNCPFEFYVSHIKSPHILKQLLDKNWTNNAEIRKWSLPRSYRMKYKKTQILWYSNIVYECKCTTKKCKCSLIPRFFKVRIVKAIRPRFYGELMPPYQCYVFLNHPMIGKYLWAHEVSLYETEPPSTQPFEEIEDIIYSWVKSCPKYKQICLLGSENIPLHCDIESAYFDKKDCYDRDEPKLNTNIAYNPLFENEYKMEIGYLLNKTFGQVVKAQTLPKSVRIRATKLNLMKYAIFVSPYRFDLELKPYFVLNGSVLLYKKKLIELTVTEDKIKNFRNQNLCIEKDDNEKSAIELQNDILLKYNREKSVLYVSSFEYVCNNRHVVVSDENNTDEKIDENEILENMTDNDLY